MFRNTGLFLSRSWFWIYGSSLSICNVSRLDSQSPSFWRQSLCWKDLLWATRSQELAHLKNVGWHPMYQNITCQSFGTSRGQNSDFWLVILGLVGGSLSVAKRGINLAHFLTACLFVCFFNLVSWCGCNQMITNEKYGQHLFHSSNIMSRKCHFVHWRWKAGTFGGRNERHISTEGRYAFHTQIPMCSLSSSLLGHCDSLRARWLSVWHALVDFHLLWC